MPTRLLSRLLPPVAVVVCLAVVATLAAWSQGFPVRTLELNDSGVWVTNDMARSYGRLNKAARGLDAYLEPPGSGGSVQPLDVLQDAQAVVEVDPSTQVLVPIDSMAVTNQGDAAVQLLPGSRVDLRGGTAAAISPDGKVWATRYDPARRSVDVRGLDPANKPLADLGAAPVGVAYPVAIAVGVDGTVHAVSANGTTATLAVQGDQLGEPSYGKVGSPLASVQLTAVGPGAVVLDAEAGLLVLPGGQTKQLTADPAAVLQQPGPDTASVLVGTSTGLVKVRLTDGETATAFEASGAPAAPVRLGACDFAAWGGASAQAVRGCDQGPYESMAVLAKAQPLQRPVFRVNRNVIVLNDSADGRIFDLDAQLRLDNWDKVRPPKNTDPTNNDPKNREQDIRESRPKANPDTVGVRPDRTTTAYLLDNDTDSASGILMITRVAGLPSGVQADVSADGQTVKLALGRTATNFSFQYTISNGYNSDTGDAHVVVRRPEQNGKPHLREGYSQPDYSVASWGTLELPITADWRDPDGDPIALTEATVGDEPLPITPDGRVLYSPGKENSDVRRKLSYRVTDSGEDVAGTVSVKVLKSTSVVGAPPVAQPDAVRGEAGSPIVVYPLANDLPGSDPRNPQARLALGGPPAPQPGLKVVTDEKSGRLTVTAAKAGTYTLEYTATFGSSRASKSRIRVDVVREQTSNQPVAMPDQAAIRGSGSVLIDAIANDYDPLGGMLTVQEAVPHDARQLSVAVVSGRWLLITPRVPEVRPSPQVIRYTVTNGVMTASGDVKVTVLKALKDNRPIVRNDLALVRDNDSLLIPVLSNDSSQDGTPLTLVTNNIGPNPGELPIIDPEDKSGQATDVGRAFVHGDRIRYIAPAKVAAERQVIIEYAARNADGQSAPGQVLVTIKPQPANPDADRAPAPEPVETRVTSGDRVVVGVPISGQDPDGDSVTVTGIASAPKLGRVVGYNPAGFTYEAFPNEDAVGTDTFGVLVADRYGKTGVAAVRIAVVPPGQTQPPVAIEDRVTASPNAKVRVDAVANDLFSRTDRVGIADLKELNDPLPAGVSLADAAGPIVLQSPAADSQPLLIDYALQGNGGTGAPATVKVISQEGYQNPPVIADLTAEVSGTSASVDLLKGAWDPDGIDAQLVASIHNAPEKATLVGGTLTVPMTDHPQVIAYQVSDPAGAANAAVVVVPAMGVGAPQLKVDGEISVDQDSSVTVALGDYVTSPRERPVRFTGNDSFAAAPGQLRVERVDATHFKVTAGNGYVGPGSVTFEVMDSSSQTDPDVAVGFVTIPVQVGPRTPVLRCPDTVQTVLAGGRPKTLDIASLCHVWSPDPAQIGNLVFSATWAQGIGGVEARPGHEVILQASGAAVPDSVGVLTIGVEGTPAKTQQLRVKVLEAPPPTMRGRTITDVKQGTPVRIPMGISSPLLDARPTIVKVRQISGPGASVSTQGSVLTITPDGNVDGRMSFEVTGSDVADPGRTDRQVTAVVTLVVYGVPGKPGTPQPGLRAQSHAETLTWTAPDDNGAAIDYYEVRTSTGKTQRCSQTTCQITGLDNGVPVRFTVRAHNRAGFGEPSAPSRSITPDQPPPAVGGLRVSNPQDHTLTLSWNKVVVDGTPVRTYYISYGGIETTASGSATSKVLTGMDNNTIYTITIAAKNDYPELGPSSSIKGQSAGKPLGLGSPTFTPADLVGADTSLRVSWSPADKNGPTDLTYKVVRDGGKTICAGTQGTSCTDDSVAFTGASHTYQVTATNGAGFSSSASGTWKAVGTPETPPAPVARPTGSDHQVRIAGGVPDSRGAQGTLRFFVDGTQVKSQSVNPRGDGYDLVLSAAPDGAQHSFAVQLCNETRCGSRSAADTATPFGDIQGLSAGNGGANGTKVTLTVSVNPNGRALNVFVNGNQEATTDDRDGTWSRSFTYDLGAFSTSRTFNVVVKDSSRSASDSVTLRSEDPPPPAKTVRVSTGAAIYNAPGCNNRCYYIHVKTTGFAGESYTCNIWADNGGDHVFRSYSFTGNIDRDMTAYYGYFDNNVWAVCGGVPSPKFDWPP